MAFFSQKADNSATGKQRRQQRRKQGLAATILPNALTLLALCCGISAIRLAFEGRFELAVVFILIAALIDAFDGSLARLLGSESKFGAELDSLADLVNFGVAPAVLVYLWGLDGFGLVGWGAALGFAICSALRLARFNVAHDSKNKPAWMTNYFEGVPAPAGAFLALLPLYLSQAGWIEPATSAPWALIYVGIIAGLMISRLPTFAGKLIGRSVSRSMLLPPAAAAIAVAVLLTIYPWHVLSVLALGYAATLPVSRWRHARLKARSRRE